MMRRRLFTTVGGLAAALALLANSAALARPKQPKGEQGGTVSALAAAVAAAKWRQGHERAILAEFVDFLAIPNVARDQPDIERNAEALRAMLEKRGLAVQVLREGDAPPLVVADVPGPAGARTIAFYAHYDGQPTDTLSWNGLPWTPVLRDPRGREIAIAGRGEIDPESRLYARSAGDDKGAILAMLAALDALKAAKIEPAFRLRLVFEGEEEAGSPHLGAYLAAHPDVLRPDAWMICDGPVHQSGRILLGYGARGTTSVEMTVYGPLKGLHDGHYGNWVPNPAARLTRLLASLRDDNGRSTIPGFLNEVVPPTAAERAAVAAIPNVEPALRREFAIGSVEGSGESLNQALLRPAINIRGLSAGGVGERASNTIPTQARASIDFRLVPNQTPETVRAHVEKYLAQQGWTVVTAEPDSATRMRRAKLVRLDWGPGYPAARTSMASPLSNEMTAILRALARDPVRMPTLGGSVPMYLFQQPRGTPAIILPIANHDDNQHAPNENLRLMNLWSGIDVFAAMFGGLAGR